MTKIIRQCYSRLLNKIFAIVIVMAAAMLILSGCSLNSKSSKNSGEFKVGVLVYDEYDTFVGAITKHMSEWCKEKERESGQKITIDIVSASGSQLTQNDQAEKFIARNYDALCINLVDRTDASVIIDKAIASDTPVIFFNRELVEEDLDRWDKLYYVGATAEQSARLQAEIIIDALSDPKKFDEIDVNHNGTIQYVILEGEAGHQDALVRTQVVTKELKNAGFSLEKLGDEFANWNRDQAKTKMKALMDKYFFQIEMVIANDDDMALGAIDALEEQGYPISPFIVGINGTKDGLEAIRTMKLNGSVYNDCVGQADAIMKIAYALGRNEPFPSDVPLTFGKYVYLPYSKITYENVQEYITTGN